MNWYDRQQRVNEVTASFKDIDFTPKELAAVSKTFTPIPMLILKGPDDEFEAALQKHVDEIRRLVKKRYEKRNKKPVSLKGPVFAVEWIEIDFGQRPEGWALFMDLKACLRETKKASEKGPYDDGGGYLGPERPLRYYEIPVEGLKEEYIEELAEKGKTHTENYWSPKYIGNPYYIK